MTGTQLYVITVNPNLTALLCALPRWTRLVWLSVPQHQMPWAWGSLFLELRSCSFYPLALALPSDPAPPVQAQTPAPPTALFFQQLGC